MPPAAGGEPRDPRPARPAESLSTLQPAPRPARRLTASRCVSSRASRDAQVQERRSGSARKEWQRVGLVVSAASEIGVRARRMSVGVGTGLANLRNSFSTSTTEDTDRDCTVDNEEECELVA